MIAPWPVLPERTIRVWQHMAGRSCSPPRRRHGVIVRAGKLVGISGGSNKGGDGGPLDILIYILYCCRAAALGRYNMEYNDPNQIQRFVFYRTKFWKLFYVL